MNLIFGIALVYEMRYINEFVLPCHLFPFCMQYEKNICSLQNHIDNFNDTWLSCLLQVIIIRSDFV